MTKKLLELAIVESIILPIVNEREASGTGESQVVEVEKVHEFKDLGSTVQSSWEYVKEVKKRV